WCSKVTAELLVPPDALRVEYRRGEELRDVLSRLARRFKVSTPVILRRIHDLGELTQHQLREAYERELQRLRSKRKTGRVAKPGTCAKGIIPARTVSPTSINAELPAGECAVTDRALT